MRTWIIIGLAAVVGIGIGIGMAWVKIHSTPWDGTPEGEASGIARLALPPGAPRPKVVVDDDTHNFGIMDSNAKGTHDFVFTNAGDAPLTLEATSTSCKCAVTDLEKKKLAPGESGKLTLEWTGKSREYVGRFVQYATITTNDPTKRKVKLTIRGRVTLAVLPVPQVLDFSGVRVGEGRSGTVQLFGFREDSLEISGYEFSDPATAEHFRVAFKPLTPDQVKEEEDATSGHLVEVTLKPGLPQGPLEQTILLKTNSKEAPTVEIPVAGKIVGEIFIFGQGWSEETGVLTLGRVKSRDGAERTVFIRAGGPYGKEVDVKPIEIVPDLVEVEPGKRQVLADGKVALIPVTIRIPKDSPPANHLGSEEGKLGRITLETTHPDVPRLRILLRFAIEG